MSSPLLQTKLRIPRVRSELVSRPGLIEKLNAGLPGTGGGFARKLTLVSAPAGFGKTTVLGNWLNHLGDEQFSPAPTPLAAPVRGVCSTTNLDLVKSLGADRVIDYTKEDFTKGDETYDVIFDVVGKLQFSHWESRLRQGGTYLVTVPTLDAIRNSAKVTLGDAAPKAENLRFLKELIEAGKVRPIIDRRYPLEQIAAAFRYVEKGHKKGNVVITIARGDEWEGRR